METECEPRPTTTCLHCGGDFHDRSLIPLDTGGELCHDCMDTLRDAAPDLLAALQAFIDLAPDLTISKAYRTLAATIMEHARNAIAKAQGNPT